MDSSPASGSSTRAAAPAPTPPVLEAMSAGLAVRGAAAGALSCLVGVLLASAVLGDAASTALWILLAAIAGGLGALIGAASFYRSAGVVRQLRDASARLAEGELEERVQASAGPLGELTHAFNSMAVRVQDLFESVAAEHARLEAVFDASTDAMVALSRDASIRFINPAAASVFGVTIGAATGRPFIETARDYELDALVRRAIAAPGASDSAIITFGAARTPLRAAAVPIPNGGDWAVLLMLTDLTEVQRLDQVRRDFLGNVSHELRTPLASIRALVETMGDGPMDAADQAEFLRRILQQVDRLTSLVNELLDLSRIESGAIDLRPEAVDLGEAVAEAASLLRVRAEAQGVTIDCPPRGGAVVEADRASVLRIVSNLLDNAIKYSSPGSTIHAATADEGDLVALSVRDEGPGIAAQDLPRVFERFYKGEASRSSAGVGLGLAIVKHLVRAHGGTTAVESRPGEGATFTIRLPKTFVGRQRRAN